VIGYMRSTACSAASFHWRMAIAIVSNDNGLEGCSYAVRAEPRLAGSPGWLSRCCV